MRKIKTKAKKMLADTLTPVSIYLKIRDRFAKSILLESTDFHHLENSFSFICISPLAEFIVQGEIITKVNGDVRKKPIDSETSVIEELHGFIKSFIPENNEYSFNGFFGYLSYDSIQYFETVKLNNNPDMVSVPEIQYSLFRYVIAFNHFKDEVILLENLFDSEESELEKIESLLNNGKVSNYPFRLEGEEQTNLTDDEFVDVVKNAKKHCLRGDVFQLVVSRRFSQSFRGDEFNVYRQLRSLNPSPYLFYFDYGSFRIFGSSPESQIEIKNNKAFINPIAGTYPRSGQDEKDKELAKALSEDPKENAEHVMLVDLARNDLSRNTNNVKVENYKEIHFYSHVIHIVSKVSGELNGDRNSIRVMADSFPAGTLSGAPKYRAMQLIDKYEPNKRGFYGGCIGFIGFNGDVNHAIMIRTFLSKNNQLHYQAGAGIVTKSNEINELQEVNHKLGALKEAIQRADNQKEKVMKISETVN